MDRNGVGPPVALELGGAVPVVAGDRDGSVGPDGQDDGSAVARSVTSMPGGGTVHVVQPARADAMLRATAPPSPTTLSTVPTTARVTQRLRPGTFSTRRRP